MFNCDQIQMARACIWKINTLICWNSYPRILKKKVTLVKGKINYLLQLHTQRWQLSDTRTIFSLFYSQESGVLSLSQLAVSNAVKEYKVDVMHEDLKKKKKM